MKKNKIETNGIVSICQIIQAKWSFIRKKKVDGKIKIASAGLKLSKQLKSTPSINDKNEEENIEKVLLSNKTMKKFAIENQQIASFN